MIEELNARIVRLLLAAAAVIIFLLGFLVCADVFGRAFLNSPVKGTPEIVSMSIVTVSCPMPATSAELRLALFEEGAQPLLGVGRGLHQRRGEALGEEAVRPRHVLDPG